MLWQLSVNVSVIPPTLSISSTLVLSLAIESDQIAVMDATNDARSRVAHAWKCGKAQDSLAVTLLMCCGDSAIVSRLIYEDR
jgi:hypothetical protein